MVALLLLASPEWYSSSNAPQVPCSISTQHAHSLGRQQWQVAHKQYKISIKTMVEIASGKGHA